MRIQGRRAVAEHQSVIAPITRSGQLNLLVGSCAAVALIAAACTSSPAPTTPAPATGLARGNVLLVTIDTLRVDHVGAYGSKRGATPTLDRLAAEGVRVETTYAHVPLTLPSHTALMTGAYPFVNGVRDNGSFRFDGKLPTLASVLKTAGYRTGAFVSAFVLDARYGLTAGFDVYDDRYGARPAGGDLSLVERPANDVLPAATRWIAQPGGQTVPRQPWFAWVHLYDPHDPYDPPEPFRSRYANDLYSGEIAFADAQLGAALDDLQRRGLLSNALVVVAADHGESLGEHQERTHGLFAYDATLRVPLILWAPPVVKSGVLTGPARLVDVMPSVLDLVGVSTTVPSGRSLWPFVRDRQPIDDAGVYFEALNASLTRGWAPLTGLVSGRRKFIDLPIPELYDLAADPGEQVNRFSERPTVASSMQRALSALSASAPQPVPAAIDRETQQRLQSLGYVASAAPTNPRGAATAADDPKTLVGLHNRLDDALSALRAGQSATAERLLTSLIRERSDFTVAYDRLAQLYRDTGRLPRAIETLESAARHGVADAASLAALGGYLQEAGRLERAAQVLAAALQLNPSEMEVYEKLGITYTQMRRFEEAHKMFEHMLSVAPNSATTYNNLGSLLLTQGRWSEAADSLKRALAIDPNMANAHNGLGVALAQQGQLDQAIEEWRRALELRPDLRDARDNIQRAEKIRGRSGANRPL